MLVQNQIFVYIYKLQNCAGIKMEIFVLIACQEDSLLDVAIFASRHDASSSAHVSLKFPLSVTNQN
jgi:hypothetical protein